MATLYVDLYIVWDLGVGSQRNWLCLLIDAGKMMKQRLILSSLGADVGTIQLDACSDGRYLALALCGTCPMMKLPTLTEVKFRTAVDSGAKPEVANACLTV